MEPRELTPTETRCLKEIYNLGLTDHITKEEIVERFTAHQRRTSKPEPEKEEKPGVEIVNRWMLYNLGGYTPIPKLQAEFVLCKHVDGSYEYQRVKKTESYTHSNTARLRDCTLKELNKVLKSEGVVATSLTNPNTQYLDESDFVDVSLSPGAGISYISSQAALDSSETYQPQMPSEELGIPIRKKNSSTRLSL